MIWNEEFETLPREAFQALLLKKLKILVGDASDAKAKRVIDNRKF